MNPHPHWIITADARKASLFSSRTTEGGELHLDLVRSLANQHEGEHEHHRPSMIGGGERSAGRGGSTNAAPHMTSIGHTEDEEHRRFARETGAWLQNAAKEFGAGNLTVLAAPRVLGLLRNEVGDFAKHADLREADLSHLYPGELAAHPAVRSALKDHAAGRPEKR